MGKGRKEDEDSDDEEGEGGAAKDEILVDKKGFSLLRIWSTRDIQLVTNFNREALLKTSLLEFLIFIVFAVSTVLFMMSLRTINGFFLCHAIKNTFFRSPIADKESITFVDIATRDQFWGYLEGNLLKNLYIDQTNQTNWVLDQNLLIGEPQIRQKKVRNGTCSIPSNIKTKINECYGAFTEANEEVSDLSIRTGNSSKFLKKNKVSTVTYYGTLTSYKASGYYAKLSNMKVRTASNLQELRSENWIDRSTRAVFFDFFLLNPSTATIAAVTLAGEFSMTGGVFTSYNIRTVRLIHYQDGIIITLSLVFFGFIVFYLLEEILEAILMCIILINNLIDTALKSAKLFSTQMLILRNEYYTLFSTYLDVSIITCGLLLSMTVTYSYMSNKNLDDESLELQDYASNILYMGYVQQFMDGILAFLVFCIFLKMFKYLSLNETMTKLSETLYSSSKDLLGYSILFFFVILSFGLLGMLLFGYQVAIFSSLGYSIVALFRILLGDIDFEYIDDKHSIIGAAYLIIYIVTVYFILINVFLAIIFESFSRVKAYVEKKKFEIYPVDYIKRKCGKKQKSTGKKPLSQWVNDMINQGYPDEAIDFVISSHTRQNVKLDSVLDNHQLMTLTFELENYVQTNYSHEKIGVLEKQFEELQDQLEGALNSLIMKQNEHKVAMLSLLDAIKDLPGSGETKANHMYQLIKNELNT
ncbi:hypothetical protein HELRODRAFT_188686, partial [Helobdella robusta]|uniref:Polycystin cation channel PKD1/PKD2 domain-containing protein n=1 Tax=Helobdella robusta TaxID=6412 RepID=T1FQ92_HELRO